MLSLRRRVPARLRAPVALALCALLAAACGESAGPPVTAVYELTRASHFFGAPFPSDLLRNPSGTIDLSAFPTAEGLGTPIFKGYARRFGTSQYGFGLNTGLYQKLSGPIDEVSLVALSGRAPTTADALLLFPLTAASAADLVALNARFLPSANGDPYITDNLVLANPRPSSPLRGGVSYAFVVRGDALRTSKNGPTIRDAAFDALWRGTDAARASTLQLPALKAALGRLGVPEAAVASATVFTTVDVDAQLAAIRAAVEASLRDEHLALTGFKEVVRVEYATGQTRVHHKDAAIMTITYKDGSTATTELDPDPAYAAPLDLTSPTYPYRVFEGRLRTLNFQGLADKPYGTPGLGIINDAALDTGQIHFARDGQGKLTVSSTPEAEEMRVVIMLPLDENRRIRTRAPVVFFDHGTGYNAFTVVLDEIPQNRSADLRALWASHRAILVSRDQPLFGQRFEAATDLGFNAFLVAYNVANITAFRDNLRQSAIDNLVTWRFVRDKLNAFFAAQGLSTEPVADTARLHRFGHSLGSVTTHLATAFLQGAFQSSCVSGSGGLLSLFFLESGLLPRLAGDPQNLGVILQALDIDPNGELTTQELLGGLAGVPKGPGRAQIERDHPVVTLAQSLLDPADPIAFARELTLPISLIRGTGDLQVPNDATDALTGVLPNVTVTRCEPTSDYDPHQCAFREDAGLAAIRAWLDAYLSAR